MKQLGVLLLHPECDASPSQGTKHEATRSITTPPGWDASPSQRTQHEATRSITTPPWLGYLSIIGLDPAFCLTFNSLMVPIYTHG